MNKKRTSIFSIINIKDWTQGKVSLPKIIRKGTAKISGDASRISRTNSISPKRGVITGNNTKNTGAGIISTKGTINVSSSVNHITTGSSKIISGSGGRIAGSSPSITGTGRMKRGFGSTGPKVIIKLNYMRGSRRVALHLKYIEHRQQDERGELFSEKEDNLNRFWFLNRFKETDNVFRIVISPADKDVDLKDMVRNVMKEFEREKNREMLWIAAIHKDPEHTSHPHVHMVLSASANKNLRIRIERYDIEFLKKEASEYISREKNLLNEIREIVSGLTKKEKTKDMDNEKNKEIDIGL